MNPLKILAILLILAGGLGLAFGRFSYTEETHEADLGALSISIKDEQTVIVPVWLSIAALGGGLVVLVFDARKS